MINLINHYTSNTHNTYTPQAYWGILHKTGIVKKPEVLKENKNLSKTFAILLKRQKVEKQSLRLISDQLKRGISKLKFKFKLSLKHHKLNGTLKKSKISFDLKIFKSKPLLCWRSELAFLNLRTYFLNVIKAMHLVWTVAKNNGNIVLVNHGGPLDSQAHLNAVSLSLKHQIQSTMVPRIKLPAHIMKTFISRNVTKNCDKSKKVKKSLKPGHKKKLLNIATKFKTQTNTKRALNFRGSRPTYKSKPFLKELTEFLTILGLSEENHNPSQKITFSKGKNKQKVSADDLKKFSKVALTMKLTQLNSRFCTLAYGDAHPATMGFFSNSNGVYKELFNPLKTFCSQELQNCNNFNGQPQSEASSQAYLSRNFNAYNPKIAFTPRLSPKVPLAPRKTSTPEVYPTILTISKSPLGFQRRKTEGSLGGNESYWGKVRDKKNIRNKAKVKAVKQKKGGTNICKIYRLNSDTHVAYVSRDLTQHYGVKTFVKKKRGVNYDENQIFNVKHSQAFNKNLRSIDFKFNPENSVEKNLTTYNQRFYSRSQIHSMLTLNPLRFPKLYPGETQRLTHFVGQPHEVGRRNLPILSKTRGPGFIGCNKGPREKNRVNWVKDKVGLKRWLGDLVLPHNRLKSNKFCGLTPQRKRFKNFKQPQTSNFVGSPKAYQKAKGLKDKRELFGQLLSFPSQKNRPRVFKPHFFGTEGKFLNVFNSYDSILIANHRETFARFAKNPLVNQANVILFSHPEKAVGLVNQARNLQIPTIGLLSGSENKIQPKVDVDFPIIGNSENQVFVTLILRNFITLASKARCGIQPTPGFKNRKLYKPPYKPLKKAAKF